MIKKLEKQFTGRGEVRGVNFKLNFEDDRFYIFEIKEANLTYYEVFRKKIVPLCINFEQKIFSDTDFKEVYPKAKDFGLWAWTFRNLDDAKIKIAEL